jgi:hypothetical protein
MNLLGVDIPPLKGAVQLHFLMTKKRSLEMMECIVDSEVVKAVQQRTDKVKIARTANVEEIEAAVEQRTVIEKIVADMLTVVAMRR